MSKIVEITFDCGFKVGYALATQPTEYIKRTLELTADVEHERDCQRCKEQEAEQEQ